MKRNVMLIAVAMGLISHANAQTQPHSAVVWAVNPSGQQPLPNAPPINLLTSPDAPLQTATGDRCLLVARRGAAIQAIELAPLTIGPKIVGWKPEIIDASRLTSTWGYAPPKWTADQPQFDNPVTTNIAASSKIDQDGAHVANVIQSSSSASAKTWSHASTDSHGKPVAETESSESVTINGKTYSHYTHFKSASADVPLPMSDEYYCR